MMEVQVCAKVTLVGTKQPSRGQFRKQSFQFPSTCGGFKPNFAIQYELLELSSVNARYNALLEKNCSTCSTPLKYLEFNHTEKQVILLVTNSISRPPLISELMFQNEL